MAFWVENPIFAPSKSSIGKNIISPTQTSNSKAYETISTYFCIGPWRCHRLC